MKDKGISQESLAAKIDRSQSALSRRLLGQIPFSIPELEMIAEALDLSLSDLFDAGKATA